jgi:hypothetical protein
MATASEYLALYVLEYTSLLSELELFGKEHPDNIDGYNILIKIGEQIQLRASAAGFTKLPPLPPRK